MEKLIAYCGMDCAECPAYLATKNNDQSLREKTAAEWTIMHDYAFTPDMINCTSCKCDGAKICYCSMCCVRKCAIEKGVAECAACAEAATCETIKNFNEYVAEAKKKLEAK